MKIWITSYKKVKKLNFHDKCQLCRFFHVFNTHGSLSNKQSRALPFFQIKYLPKSLESNYLLYNTYQMLIFEGSGIYTTGGFEDHPCLFIFASVDLI